MKILWEVFEIAVNFFQGFVMIYFAYSYLGDKKERAFFRSSGAMFAVLLAALLCIINKITVFEHFYAVLYIVLVFVYSIIFLNGKILKKVFASAFPVLIVLVLTALSGNLAAVIFDKSLYEILSYKDFDRFITMLVVQILILYVVLLALKILKKDNDDRNELAKSEWIVISVTLFMSIVIGAFINLISLEDISHKSRVYLSLSLICIVLINIIVCWIVIDLKRKNAEITESKLLKLKSEYNRKYVENANIEYEAIKKLRHDFKDTYRVIYALIDEGSIEKAKAHMESIQKNLCETKIFVRTDNDIANAVINSKLSTAKPFDVESVCISVKSFDGIDDMDLCKLLSNLLDNAIAACVKAVNKPKQILLKITADEYSYNFNLKNTIDKSVLKSNPELKTTKGNKAEHGYGIKAIKEVTRKYNGKCDFYEEDNFFCCNIVLNK